MRSSATTAAIQYPTAAIIPPATTPPMLFRAKVDMLAKTAVKRIAFYPPKPGSNQACG
jgi:hypothetical protein